MPKIAANGNPSYAGHEGIVENARDEKFEVNPLKDIEGNDSPGLEQDENEPDPVFLDGAEGVPSENTDGREGFTGQDRQASEVDPKGEDPAATQDEDAGTREAVGKDSARRAPVKSAGRTAKNTR
jgi:hypothetical protein